MCTLALNCPGQCLGRPGSGYGTVSQAGKEVQEDHNHIHYQSKFSTILTIYVNTLLNKTLSRLT